MHRKTIWTILVILWQIGMLPAPPPNPINQSAYTWIFIALQKYIDPYYQTAIVQPCIGTGIDGKWHGSAVYGHIDKDHYYYSSDLPLNKNDVVEGYLSYDPQQALWFIRVWDNTKGTYTANLSIDAPEFDNSGSIYADCSLEQYSVSAHSDLPGDTTFQNIDIRDSNNYPISFEWDKQIDPIAHSLLQGLYVDSPFAIAGNPLYR